MPGTTTSASTITSVTLRQISPQQETNTVREAQEEEGMEEHEEEHSQKCSVDEELTVTAIQANEAGESSPKGLRVNERRRHRYREDPNYRERTKERDRKYQAKKRQERQPIILAAESTTLPSAEPTETTSSDPHEMKFEEHEQRRKRVRERQSMWSKNHNKEHNERRRRKYRENSSYRELAKDRDRKHRARKKLERQSTLTSIESTDAPGTPAMSEQDVMSIAFITE
jgi:hypothetical protein